MGKHTVYFKNKPSLSTTYSVVSNKEGDGPIGAKFDMIIDDDYFGEKTFEKAECKMLSTAIDRVIKRANIRKSDIDAMLSGDLLNQIVSASFAATNSSLQSSKVIS